MTGRAESEEQKRKAAEWAVQAATPDTITAALKRMQIMKGRTYTEVAERMYGQEIDANQLTHIERAICEMMQVKRMTLADLTEWYKFALETVFDGDRFTPLPDYTDCVQLVNQARDATRRLRNSAAEIVEPAPVVEEIRQIASRGTAKTMPELFNELKLKFE